MLVGTNSGLILIDGNNIQNLKNQYVDSILINFMVRDVDSSVLIVTDRSIVRYANEKFTKVFELKEIGNVIPSCIARDKKNNNLIGFGVIEPAGIEHEDMPTQFLRNRLRRLDNRFWRLERLVSLEPSTSHHKESTSRKKDHANRFQLL